jgi:methyl-accepting chemotaxis protein
MERSESHDPRLSALASWLLRIYQERDLQLPQPPLDQPSERERAIAHALNAAVARYRRELGEYAEIAAEADAAVALNRRQCAEALAHARDYWALVEQAAAALQETGQGAARIADETASLAHEARAAAGASHRACEDVAQATQALASLVEDIGRGDQFARSMHDESAKIFGFVDAIARISRQAVLLGVNATIEAAHLGDTGKGFAIVAGEVRKLAASTGDSAREVGGIARQASGSATQVASTTGSASESARGVYDDITRAGGEMAATHEKVTDLQRPIAQIAAIAEEQSTALPQITTSFDRIATLAQRVSADAESTAAIDLERLLVEVRTIAGRYQLGAAHRNGQVQHVDETLLATLDPGIPEEASVMEALQRLDERIAGDERAILKAIMAVAVAVARNSYGWKSIAAGLEQLKSDLTQVIRPVDESRTAAAALAGECTALLSWVQRMHGEYSAPLVTLDESLSRVGDVRGLVDRVRTLVDEMTAAAERAQSILSLVDDISEETTLLALNAAIEAAHAGSAGQSFSVIAGEIRKLADRTQGSTREVAQSVDAIARTADGLQGASAGAVERTLLVQTSARAVQDVIRPLLETLAKTMEHTSEVATIAQQHDAAFSSLQREIASTIETIDSSAASATDSRRLELANIGRRAHDLAARRRLGIAAEKIREVGLEVAREIDAVFEGAISAGRITLDDCKDTNYQLIAGPAIAKLARLFDVSRVPQSGFDPPKYETRYDRFVEDGVNQVIDRWIPAHPAIKAMFAVDLNGYGFGHCEACRQAWTGDYVADLNGNRIKRFFEDELSLRCSRNGLGPAADGLPQRTPYETFERLGCNLRRSADERPWVIYTYARDNGIVYNDLSVALFASDVRIGTIRIIYDADTL